MAKKTKKRSSEGLRLSEKQRYQPVGGGTLVVPAVKAVAVTSQPADEDLAAEYRYVLTDLKKIGWLALAMLALLVALAFIVV